MIESTPENTHSVERFGNLPLTAKVEGVTGYYDVIWEVSSNKSNFQLSNFSGTSTTITPLVADTDTVITATVYQNGNPLSGLLPARYVITVPPLSSNP